MEKNAEPNINTKKIRIITFISFVILFIVLFIYFSLFGEDTSILEYKFS